MWSALHKLYLQRQATTIYIVWNKIHRKKKQKSTRKIKLLCFAMRIASSEIKYNFTQTILKKVHACYEESKQCNLYFEKTININIPNPWNLLNKRSGLISNIATKLNVYFVIFRLTEPRTKNKIVTLLEHCFRRWKHKIFNRISKNSINFSHRFVRLRPTLGLMIALTKK